MYLFTVILILPDYIGEYGTEYFFSHTAAESPAAAIINARKEAMDDINNQEESDEKISDPEDLALVGVFHGFQVPIDHAHGLH